MNKQIPALIKKLDSDVYKEREAATAALFKFGEDSIEPLKHALANKPSAEVSLRIKRLLSTLVSDAVAGLRIKLISDKEDVNGGDNANLTVIFENVSKKKLIVLLGVNANGDLIRHAKSKSITLAPKEKASYPIVLSIFSDVHLTSPRDPDSPSIYRELTLAPFSSVGVADPNRLRIFLTHVVTEKMVEKETKITISDKESTKKKERTFWTGTIRSNEIHLIVLSLPEIKLNENDIEE